MLEYESKLQNRGYRNIAGIDEVGVGPWAGPVVACACILKTFDFSSRIADSKKLTEKRRLRGYEEILQKAYVGIGIVSNDTIDEINIYQASCLAAEKALAQLCIPADYILLDGRLNLSNTSVPYQSIIDGDDKSISIACASIVAKVTRDNLMCEMDKIYKGYEFSRHKGYGTKLHRQALEKLGPCKIHRKSYRPVAICCVGAGSKPALE